MKFLAILRDSVREALDAKVIYVLFGLSALVIVLVFGISFTPEPGEQGLREVLKNFEGGRSTFNIPAPLSYTPENFTQVNQGVRVWDGEFRYTLVVKQNADFGPPKVQQDQRKNEKDGKDGKPNKQMQLPEINFFKITVLIHAVLNKPAEELTEEDKRLRNRLKDLVVQTMVASKGEQDQKIKAEQDIRNEIERVSPAQMERFIRQELGAKGALEVITVKLESSSTQEHRFQIECKAREGTVRSWPHEVSILYGAIDIGKFSVGGVVYTIEDTVVGGWGAALCMLLGSIITAFFIPNMLRKGTIDLLLAKPIHRVSLLLYKFVGGLSFVFLSLVVLVVGVWLALGIRSGLWSVGFLLTILILTFQFAIFYAVATFIGVLTRSPIVCILLACFAWLILWGIGIGAKILKPLSEADIVPKWVFNTVDSIRILLPRYKDLDTLNSQLLAHDLLDKESAALKESDRQASVTSWFQAISITCGHIGLLLGLACWRFAVKDY